MRQRVLTIGVAAALLIMCASAAAQKTDFSGTWVLDKSRSEGLPPGLEQTMAIKQTGDRVEVETKLSTANRGNDEVRDDFVLDGKEADYKPLVMPGVEVKRAKRTAKWAADGKTVEIVEDNTVDGPDGLVDIKVTRQWRLSEDGKTLTAEMTIEGPRGTRKSRRVFARK